MMRLPQYNDTLRAAERLTGIVRNTPLLLSDALSKEAGRAVYVKCENLQYTGSFKLRGAYNRLVQLEAHEKQQGVVAFSSGNHAQGVARAAKMLGLSAKIVMPEDSPCVKIEGVRADGAEILLYDRYTESREAISEAVAHDEGRIIVPSFDDPHIIAGQGSVGVEICNNWPGGEAAPGTFVCCVGGGGLIAGSSLALKAKWPDIKIWGAEPLDYDDHACSLRSGKIERNSLQERSICDALLSPAPGEMTFEINKHLLSGVGVVSDEEVKTAMRFAFSNLKLVVEPGGAAALAAFLSGKINVSGSAPIIIVLTGGNVDPQLFAEMLQT